MIEINETYATYLSMQYGADVGERYRVVCSNHSPNPKTGKHIATPPKTIESISLVCAECGGSFEEKPAKSKKMFCGKSCAGKANRRKVLLAQKLEERKTK